MTQYTLYIPRRYAVLYLAWEHGTHGAVRFMRTMPKDERGWIGMHTIDLFVPVGRTRHTRASLEQLAARIRETIAYQEGKLGKPYTAGGGCVKVEAA